MKEPYGWTRSLRNDVLKDICQRRRQASYRTLKKKTNITRPKGRPRTERLTKSNETQIGGSKLVKALTMEEIEKRYASEARKPDRGHVSVIDEE